MLQEVSETCCRHTELVLCVPAVWAATTGTEVSVGWALSSQLTTYASLSQRFQHTTSQHMQAALILSVCRLLPHATTITRESSPLHELKSKQAQNPSTHAGTLDRQGNAKLTTGPRMPAHCTVK